jgi:thiamine-monophosphate kinase
VTNPSLVSPLGPGREFDRIRAIAARLGDVAPALGDDCAFVPATGETIVLSTDMVVEGVHYRPGWLSHEEIGWRAAMAALSDVGAAGARCVGLLAAVSSPHDAVEADLVALMGGVGDAVRHVGGTVLGGDLTASPQWIVSITVVGAAARPLTRRGMRPGDGLWLTGAVGGSRAALTAWTAGRDPGPSARRAFARPEARIAAGRWLAAHGARAMMDVSDGLGGDVPHLAAASGVAVDVSLEAVPVHPAVPPEACSTNEHPAAFAAAGGEDYELLVALSPEFGEKDAERFRREVGLGLTRIGSARDGAGVRFLLAGEPVVIRGFDHFR